MKAPIAYLLCLVAFAGGLALIFSFRGLGAAAGIVLVLGGIAGALALQARPGVGDDGWRVSPE